ncbi:MAG: BMP family ABC transporter substrate-binding protein [Lachnospiraceae bacterium]|nr:BMP family ABC transporter substrate-binding protein [Lachnospiraceae bacterium]
MKKLLSMTMACLLSLSLLTGCGGGEKISEALVISNPELANDQSANLAWLGVQNYAAHSSTDAGLFINDGDFQGTVSKAAGRGAQAIVCLGDGIDTDVWKAQQKHSKTAFVYVGGEPRREAGAQADIAANTICVNFDAAQIGYLAGYAAVLEGNTHLGFISAADSSTAKAYESGFIAGADQAALTMNLPAGTVVVDEVTVLSDVMSPITMEKALKLYRGGASVIMACGENILRMTVKAAETAGKKVISAGSDWTSRSDSVLMGSTFNLEDAVQDALERVNSEGFEGGSTIFSGAAAGSIGLKCRYDKMGSFNSTSYDALYASLAAGSVTAPEDNTEGTEHVTVNKTPMA